MRIKILDILLDESKRQETSIRNSLVIMLMHMLKCKYQYDYPYKSSWRDSILNSFNEFINEFDAVGKGSLYKSFYMKKLDLDHTYQLAVRKAANETHLPISAFPNTCEWNREQLSNLHFIDQFLNEYGFGPNEERW